MSDNKHATYGPSSLKFREICAGWRNSRDGDMTAAEEGTLLHAAYETGNLSSLATAEQITAVKACLNYTRKYEQLPGAVIHKEIRLSILDGLTFGTADRLIIVKRKSYLLDAKFGWRAVDDAEVNRQGIAYVLGVFDRFDVDEVEVHFISPRRDEVTTHTFRRSDYPRLAVIVNRIVERCRAFDASINEADGTCDESLLNAHDDACAYCGFIARCPKHRGYALEVAKKYAPLELVDETHSSQISDPNQMAAVVSLSRILGKWAESVTKHATEMAKNGIAIPGYELRERAGTRAISNSVLAYQTLIESGLEPIEVVSAAKLSLSALEKIVSEKAPRGQKAKSVATLNAALANAECLTAGEPIVYLQKTRE